MNYLAFMDEHCAVPIEHLAGSFEKTWKGADAHLGPHRHTPLRDSLEMKTTNALLAVMQGCLHWAQIRLGTRHESNVLRQLSEAVCLYGVNPLYLNPVEQFFYFPLTADMEVPAAVAQTYPWIQLQRYRTLPNSLPVSPPIIQVAEAIHLTRFLMPKGLKAFDQYIRELLARLNEVAYLPDPLPEPLPPDAPIESYLAEACRVAGPPLSPLIHKTSIPFQPERDAEILGELVSTADWKNNLFLRDPDELRRLGFDGEPYHFHP